jgi:hypothetical protein
MKLSENILKGYFTTLVGVATTGITLYLVYTDKMDFVWNGVAGLSIGTVLILAPQSIEAMFGHLIDKVSGSSTYPTYPAPTPVDKALVNPNQQS